MTYEEAIKIIEDKTSINEPLELYEALKLAIEALENQEILIRLLTYMGCDFICDDMTAMPNEWCSENCVYDSPQKLCFMQYLEHRRSGEIEPFEIDS